MHCQIVWSIFKSFWNIHFRSLCSKILKLWPYVLSIFKSYCYLNIQELKLEFESRSWRGILNTKLCDKVCQWFATGRWFSPGTPISSTNKIDRYNITELLLKMALSAISHNSSSIFRSYSSFNIQIILFYQFLSHFVLTI